jgi:hypothetical protein
MLKNVRDNEAQERASKDAAMEQVAREKQLLRENVFAKAEKHGEVIGTSSKCMRDIEDAALQTDNSLALLRQERALAFASLQVCKRRIQLRDRRPKSELVQDAVSDALDREKKMLETSREDFLQMEDDGRKISEDLLKTRAHLSQDTGERRLVMKHDQQSLKPHVNNPHSQVEPRQPPSVCDGQSRTMLDETFKLLERASQHRQKTNALVLRVKDDSKKAVINTEDCLEKRTDELAALEKTLKEHMTSAESAISIAERSLDKSDKRLEPNDTAKKEKLARDRQMLDHLKKHKAQLHAEIQNKFIALEIDNMCRRVTPVKACHTPQPLNHSSSAPNLMTAAGSNNMGNMKSNSMGNKVKSSSTLSPKVEKGATHGGKFSPASSSLKSSANAQMATAKR